MVGPSDKYGEQYVTVKPDEASTYRGGSELLGENQTPSGRLEVVADRRQQPARERRRRPHRRDRRPAGLLAVRRLPRRGRDGGHRPEQPPGPGRRRPGPGQGAVGRHLQRARTWRPSDPDSKFQRLGAGIVTNLASPDVVSVEEVQDNSGATDDGTVAADQTLTKLTAAIVAAGGPQYAWREIDPANDKDGGQPGGNIRTVFLYNPARVTFVDAGAATVNRTSTGTQVVSKHGDPALTLSPGRIDPANPVWTSSRKPLVGEFAFRGEDVFVIANHFDAKLGDQNQDGRFQYPAQSSALQRAGQAQVEHDFVQKLLDVDKKADVVVLGDLNDYQFSPSLNSCAPAPPTAPAPSILTDLISTLPTNEQYTYVYDGVSEVLDHILVSKGIKDLSYQVVHVNAEFAEPGQRPRPAGGADQGRDASCEAPINWRQRLRRRRIRRRRRRSSGLYNAVSRTARRSRRSGPASTTPARCPCPRRSGPRRGGRRTSAG